VTNKETDKLEINMHHLRGNAIPGLPAGLFFVYNRRATNDPHRGDRGGPCHFCIPNVFGSDQ